MAKYSDRAELAHYGVTGMKWGVRRYQNQDGTLTPAGKERYGAGAQGREKNVTGNAKEGSIRKRGEGLNAARPAGMNWHRDENRQASADKVQVKPIPSGAGSTNVTQYAVDTFNFDSSSEFPFYTPESGATTDGLMPAYDYVESVLEAIDANMPEPEDEKLAEYKRLTERGRKLVAESTIQKNTSNYQHMNQRGEKQLAEKNMQAKEAEWKKRTKQVKKQQAKTARKQKIDSYVNVGKEAIASVFSALCG